MLWIAAVHLEFALEPFEKAASQCHFVPLDEAASPRDGGSGLGGLC
jgi:hypothetical protein